MMRFVKRFFIGLLIILLLLSIGFGWLYNSQSGLQLILSIARPYLPAELTIDEIKGSLSTKIEFEKFKWQDPSLRIAAEQGQFSCDWLEFAFGYYRCRTVNIPLIEIVSKASDENSEALDLTTLPTPQDLSLDIIAKLDSLSIKQLSFRQEMDNGQQQSNLLENIVIQQLHWQNNEATARKISIASQGAVISLMGKIAPQAQWPAELDLKLKYNEHDVNLLIKGSLLQQSSLVGNYNGLAQLVFNATMNYNQGKPRLEALLNAPDQLLTLPKADISISEMTLPILLEWPKLNYDLSANLSRGNDNLRLSHSLIVDDVINWQQSLQSNIRLDGELASNSLHQLLTNQNTEDNGVNSIVQVDQVDDKKILKPEPVAILIDIPVSIKNGHLVSKAKQINMDGFTLTTELDAYFAGAQLNKLSFKSALSSQTTPSWLPVKGEKLTASVSIDKSGAHSTWLISSNGRLANLQYGAYRLDTANWTATYNEQLTSRLSIGSVDLKLPSQNIKLNNTELNFNGTLERHNLVVNSEIDTTKLSLSVAGQVSTENNDGLWKSSKLSASVKEQSKQLDIQASGVLVGDTSLSFKELCIQGIGEICSQGGFKGKNWALQSKVEQLNLSDIPFWLEAIDFQAPLDIYGLLSGSLKISGEAEQIENFQISLNSPVLSLKQSGMAIVFSQLELYSEKNVDEHILKANWQNFASETSIHPQTIHTYAPQGEFTANVNATDDIKIMLEQSNLQLQMAAAGTSSGNYQRLEFPVKKLESSLGLKNAALSLTTNLELFEQDKINVNFNSTYPITTSSQVKGDILVSLSNFSWLKNWQSRIDAVDLDWQHQAKFSGPLERLNIQGTGEMKINQLVMEEFGLQVANSYLNIESNNENLILAGELINQQQKLNFDGNVKLWPRLEASANVTGDKITIINTEKQKLVVSPDIRSTYKNQLLDVKGSILFNEAKVEVNQIPKSRIQISEDQVYIDQDTSQEPSTKYRVNLDIIMGKAISFSGFGLTSDIGGKLNILAESGQALKAEGQLRLIDGKFEAYKQNLTIDQGQLLFLGAPDNPGIQFTASRTIDDIKVGIVADGTLLKPKLTLYSDPIMPEENILALLLTGRSIESLSESEGNALANAAISLGVEGANKIAQEIGKALGIKNIQVTSKNTADTSRINIETQLNDRLSVGYGTTIDSQNETQVGWVIEYKLSPKLSFEAVSGEEVSASITYKNQFGRKEKNKEQD